MSGVDFSRNAAVYDDRHGASIDDALAERLIDQAALGGGSIVLDVGAGTGRVAIPLAARGCRVVAKKNAEEAKVAKRRERARGRSAPSRPLHPWRPSDRQSSA